MSYTAVLIHIVSVMSIPNLIKSTPCLVNSYKSTSSPLFAIPAPSVPIGAAQRFSLPLRIRRFSQLRVVSSRFFSNPCPCFSVHILHESSRSLSGSGRSNLVNSCSRFSEPIDSNSLLFNSSPFQFCRLCSFPHQFSANRSILIHSKSNLALLFRFISSISHPPHLSKSFSLPLKSYPSRVLHFLRICSVRIPLAFVHGGSIPVPSDPRLAFPNHSERFFSGSIKSCPICSLSASFFSFRIRFYSIRIGSISKPRLSPPWLFISVRSSTQRLRRRSGLPCPAPVSFASLANSGRFG
jgi:hypothetical protein